MKTASRPPRSLSTKSGRRLPLGSRSLPPTLLAKALKSLPEGVFIAPARWHREGFRIIFANERFCAMTGFTDTELRLRDHTFLHVDKTEVQRQRRWFRGAASGNTYAAEGYLTRRDGSALFAAWLLSPLCNSRGEVTHIVASYRDVTEKRRLQEALIHAQRIDAVGRLAGGVAHDFNNLLSVINGYSEILADRLAHDERARHDLAEIHAAGQKAAALTRQLLAFSRRQAMDPRVINLNDVIHDHAELLTRLLRPDKRLNLALDPQLTNIRADPAALQQVLLNLTLNARDALQPGGHVTISTSRRFIKPGMTNRRLTDMPPGPYVQLAVSDSGSGMDERVQAHLFEPFFTTKPQGQGTGLGLALVYGVVQQSRGYIFVHSAPGIGTTFDIFLPEVLEPVSERPPVLSALPAIRGKERVLIIEADDVLRKMIGGILTADGYTVQTAADASSLGHDVAGASPPFDLLIMDQHQGFAESEQLAVRLKAGKPDLRVLMTSDSETPKVLEHISAPAQAHLSKPFTLSTLLKAIRTLLDGPSALE